MGQSQAICSFTCEFIRVICLRGLPYGPAGKDSTFNVGDTGDASSIPWVGKVPWRRKWQPTPVCLPEKSCRQRSLAGYNPWGWKESDTTEQLTLFKIVALRSSFTRLWQITLGCLQKSVFFAEDKNVSPSDMFERMCQRHLERFQKRSFKKKILERWET